MTTEVDSPAQSRPCVRLEHPRVRAPREPGNNLRGELSPSHVQKKAEPAGTTMLKLSPEGEGFNPPKVGQ